MAMDKNTSVNNSHKGTKSDLDNEKPTKDEFSFYLCNMREYLGLTKEDFALAIKVNPRTYYSYESSRSMPGNWEEIQKRVQQLVKTKSINIKNGIDENSVLNSSLEEQILDLHNEGKNIVQIGIDLAISEELVEAFLIDKGYNPKYYNLHDSVN